MSSSSRTGPFVLTSGAEPQLHSDGLLDGFEISLGKPPHTIIQARLAHRRQLVRHRLVLFATQHDESLTWIHSLYIGRERGNLQAVQVLVGGVVADDHRGPLFSHFTADRGFEVYPPDFTALNRQHLRA